MQKITVDFEQQGFELCEFTYKWIIFFLINAYYSIS